MKSSEPTTKPWEALRAAIARQHQTEPGTWLRRSAWLRGEHSTGTGDRRLEALNETIRNERHAA